MRKSYPKHILLKMPNWLGDVVLSLPALSALRVSFPDSGICAVGNETARMVLSLSRLSMEFVHFDRHGDRLAGDPAAGGAGRSASPDGDHPPAGMWRTWREALGALRGRRWDLAVTFAESFSSALLLRLAGAKDLIGYRADGRRLLLSKPLPRKRMGMRPHLAREYMALAEAAGAKAGNEAPSLDVSETLAREAREILSVAGVELSRPLVGLCPGAAYGPSKRWPVERFADAGRELTSGGGAVAVFGSHSERAAADRLSSAIPGAASVAGKTSVEQLAGCLSICSVVIANDSGAAHLAAAVGSSVVAIFGSTDASWTRPLGAKVAVVKASGLECAPCFGKECDRGYACLTGISDGDVVRAARALAGGALG